MKTKLRMTITLDFEEEIDHYAGCLNAREVSDYIKESVDDGTLDIIDWLSFLYQNESNNIVFTVDPITAPNEEEQ